MLIKVKVTGEIIQLATLLQCFNTLWLCHQQLASLLPLNFKVAFSYNKSFIIKIFLFGFTKAFEISFISEVAAVAEHTTINPLSEWETTSNKQKNELNHKTLISWPDRDINYWWNELIEYSINLINWTFYFSLYTSLQVTGALQIRTAWVLAKNSMHMSKRYHWFCPWIAWNNSMESVDTIHGHYS